MVDCPFCDGEQRIRDEKCSECEDGIIECRAEDPSSLIDGEEDPLGYFDLAKLIYYSRERSWTPSEFWGQSAVFVQAYDLFLPTMYRYLDEEREKVRRLRELENGRHNSIPANHP